MSISAQNKMIRRSALAALLVFSLAVAGCGSSSPSTSPSPSDTSAASQAGADVFTKNCASCHTLKAAGSKGAVGPDLDKSKLNEVAINDRVQKGMGAMPPFKDKLSAESIDAVATYVAENRDR